MWILKFYEFDLDLDPMTLILKLDLDIVKRYVCTKNEASTLNGSKVIAWTDTQTETQTDRWTDRQTDSSENITYPHTQMVKTISKKNPDMNMCVIDAYVVVQEIYININPEW